MNQANKEARVLEALKLPAGLNRFDAELIGDHCLNSTVAKLRAKGWLIRSEAELAYSTPTWTLIPRESGQ